MNGVIFLSSKEKKKYFFLCQPGKKKSILIVFEKTDLLSCPASIFNQYANVRRTKNRLPTFWNR